MRILNRVDKVDQIINNNPNYSHLLGEFDEQTVIHLVLDHGFLNYYPMTVPRIELVSWATTLVEIVRDHLADPAGTHLESAIDFVVGSYDHFGLLRQDLNGIQLTAQEIREARRRLENPTRRLDLMHLILELDRLSRLL